MNTNAQTTKAADRIAPITLGSPKRTYFDAEMGDALTEADDAPAVRSLSPVVRFAACQIIHSHSPGLNHQEKSIYARFLSPDCLAWGCGW